MTTLDPLAALPPNWTPEWVLDRGKAWMECGFGLAKIFIVEAGVLLLAWMGLRKAFIKSEAELRTAALEATVAATARRVDAQSNHIQEIALAVTPVTDEPAKVEVVNKPTAPIPTKEADTIIAGEPTA